MTIKQFMIEGYKSLKSVTWTPGSLNVLIGPNGSGKSNLLRALSLLQQAVTGSEFSKTLLQQGGIGNVLWDGKSKEIKWRLVTGPPSFFTRDKSPQLILYELCVVPAILLSSGYQISREWLTELYEVDSKWEAVQLVSRSRDKASVFDENKKELVALESSIPPDQSLFSLSPFANPYTWVFRRNIEDWGIYHNLHVHQGAPIREAAVTRVEKQVSSDGQNLIPVLHTHYTSNRDFKKSLDAAMKAAFGDEYEEIVFAPAADQRINLRIRWRSLSTPQSAADLSDGTIHFLLLLTILANPERGQIIAIDEPETGLHPGMFPIVAEFAAAAAESSTIILTTHSPQFLDAFKENVPTTTVTLWEAGETTLSVLSGEKLSHWLKEFSLGSLFKSGELEELA